MTYKTHLSAGILFSTLYFAKVTDLSVSPLVFILIVLFSILGSSTPDLDTPSGGLWQKIPAGSILSRVVRPIFIGGHRHLSHSFLGLGLFSLLFLFLIKIILQDHSSYIHLVTTAFVVGYLSHLFADMFTEKGVPLLFPFDYHFGIPPAPFEKVRIKTGRWFENIVIYPLVNIAAIFLIYKLFIR